MSFTAGIRNALRFRRAATATAASSITGGLRQFSAAAAAASAVPKNRKVTRVEKMKVSNRVHTVSTRPPQNNTGNFSIIESTLRVSHKLQSLQSSVTASAAPPPAAPCFDDSKRFYTLDFRPLSGDNACFAERKPLTLTPNAQRISPHRFDSDSDPDLTHSDGMM